MPLQLPGWPPRAIIFNNKLGPPTRLLTISKLFYGQGKMDWPNVSAQVIIRPHLFNEIRLSAPGKELRKQNALPPPLI